MRWFGESWGAYVNDTTEHMDTPVGDRCQYCHKVITANDSGFELPVADLSGELEPAVYYHRACLLRSVGVRD
jgi:hypothetical protein